MPFAGDHWYLVLRNHTTDGFDHAAETSFVQSLAARLEMPSQDIRLVVRQTNITALISTMQPMAVARRLSAPMPRGRATGEGAAISEGQKQPPLAEFVKRQAAKVPPEAEKRRQLLAWGVTKRFCGNCKCHACAAVASTRLPKAVPARFQPQPAGCLPLKSPSWMT